LASGGTISVWGEPNSLEWNSPEQGVRRLLNHEKCAGARQLTPASAGKLRGAAGILVCSDRVLEAILVFRPGGGLIYWLLLETNSMHKLEDEATLNRVAATFRLIPWQ